MAFSYCFAILILEFTPSYWTLLSDDRVPSRGVNSVPAC